MSRRNSRNGPALISATPHRKERWVRLEDLRAMVPELRDALAVVAPGELVRIEGA